MANALTAMIAMSLGVMVYLAIPILVMTAHPETRLRVGRFYMKMGARAMKQFAVVRRVLSGYDIFQLGVDAEQKLLSVTLDSSTLGGDKEHRFNDPDNRIHRLWKKPLAVSYEGVPAAIDAELAEIGHWTHEKATTEGLVRHGAAEGIDDPTATRIDPYVRMSDSLRLVDPLDAYNLVPNAVSPETIKSAEQITQKRFEKYGPSFGLKTPMRVLLGAAAGMGGVVLMQYVNSELIDGGSGGGGGIGNPIGGINLGGGTMMPNIQHVTDVVVILT